MRRRSERGATTVEWLVVAMVIGVGAIISWQAFGARVAGTVARGGDSVLALVGGPAPQPGGAPPAVAPAGSSLPVGAPVGGSPSLTWGAPGFTQGWTPQQREQYLADHGVADPEVRYFTPFWEHGPPNYYTGAADTGGTNTFGVIHDYNIGHGDWPWVANYFDVVTPLFGRTHTDIDQAATRLGHAIGDALGIR